MSSIVCQGPQSCLEPRIVESRTLRLKVASLKSNFPPSFVCASSPLVSNSDTEELEEHIKKEEKTSTNVDHGDTTNPKSTANVGGWSCIQSLTNKPENPKEAKETESLYVHPLVKRSSLRLSDKSLELCTENLGCETGSDISENSIFSSPSSDSETEKSPTREQWKMRETWGSKKVNYRNFPPPLTSISGSSCAHLRPHREGGRLVIKAVTVPSFHTYLQAERSDGRLRLHILKGYSGNLDPAGAAKEEKEEENKGGEEEEKGEADKEEFEDDEEEEVEEDGDEGEEEEEHEGVDLDGEMNGNYVNQGVEMGKRKLRRPSRCKEDRRGNKELLKWEPPFWVATS